ncbi:MAG TPA: hypothetical protein VKU90_02160 [Caulobacteraceae bacterium]|nr:hypothetical protein [Caulobacteraceae bacterium]
MLARLAIFGAAFFLIAGAAFADGPVVIAHSPRAGPPTSEPPPPLPDDGADAADSAPAYRMGPCGPQAIDANGKPDQAAHGWVDVGVGTSGYRRGAAHVCKPLGDNGSVGITIGATQGGFRR